MEGIPDTFFTRIIGLWNQYYYDGIDSPLFIDIVINGETFKLHCSLRTDAKKMLNYDAKEALNYIRCPELTKILVTMETQNSNDNNREDLRKTISDYVSSRGHKDIGHIFSSACFYKRYTDVTWIHRTYTSHIDVNQGLEAACESGDERMVSILLLMEANNFNAGLRGAANFGHDILVRKMVEIGATNINGSLEAAGIADNQPIITYLISISSQPIDYNSLLCGASRGGNITLVNFAISKGATDFKGGYWKSIQGAVQQNHSKYSAVYGSRRTIPSETHLKISIYLLQLMNRL